MPSHARPTMRAVRERRSRRASKSSRSGCSGCSELAAVSLVTFGRRDRMNFVRRQRSPDAVWPQLAVWRGSVSTPQISRRATLVAGSRLVDLKRCRNVSCQQLFTPKVALTMKDKLILVAGGGGFIGGHLVAQLARAGLHADSQRRRQAARRSGIRCSTTSRTSSADLKLRDACQDGLPRRERSLQPGRRHGRHGLHRKQQGAVHAVAC